MHFFGVFASFMRKFHVLRHGICGTEHELSVSYLPPEGGNGDESQDEADTLKTNLSTTTKMSQSEITETYDESFSVASRRDNYRSQQ